MSSIITFDDFLITWQDRESLKVTDTHRKGARDTCTSVIPSRGQHTHMLRDFLLLFAWGTISTRFTSIYNKVMSETEFTYITVKVISIIVKEVS